MEKMENHYKNKEEFKACLQKFKRQFVFGVIVLFFAHYIFFYMLNLYGTSDKKDSQIALLTHKAKTWEGVSKKLEATQKALLQKIEKLEKGNNNYQKELQNTIDDTLQKLTTCKQTIKKLQSEREAKK